jgi:NTE family protein
MKLDQPINISDFIAKTGADEIVAELKSKLSNGNGDLPAFSDLIKTETDENGNTRTFQYVNYVQEGGGVLGVGLLGYTYILEKLGIRFYKLAGTSAGAINTVLTAAVDPANYKQVAKKNDNEPLLKSEAILYELLRKDLFELVDGATLAKKIIKKFLMKKNYFGRLIDMVIVAVVILLAASAAMGILSILNFSTDFTGVWKVIKLVLAIIVVILITSKVAIYFISKKFIKLFVRSKFGICTGNDFLKWITTVLKKNGIEFTPDLEAVIKKNQEGVYLRESRAAEQNQGDTRPVAGTDLVLIASDITNQRKVEFPAMAKYYWDDVAKSCPAEFVRASMAIPIFFEPFVKKVIHAPVTEEEKMILQNIPPDTSTEKPCEVRFVDGGILSNFPINVFHNPTIKVARLPTFGVKLEDEEHEIPGKQKTLKQSLLSYVGSIFSTIRFYYDSDFLLKNRLYERSIGHVDVSKFNWLNFFLNEKDKVDLFRQGAEAAKIFFLGGEVWVDGKPRKFDGFDWESYKQQREEVVMVERKEAPNKITSK